MDLSKLIDDESMDTACRAFALSIPKENILFQKLKLPQTQFCN